MDTYKICNYKTSRIKFMQWDVDKDNKIKNKHSKIKVCIWNRGLQK